MGKRIPETQCMPDCIAPIARGFGLRMTVWLVTVDDSLRDQLDLDAILTVVDAKHCLQHIKRENKPEKVNEVWPLVDRFTFHAYVCRNWISWENGHNLKGSPALICIMALSFCPFVLKQFSEMHVKKRFRFGYQDMHEEQSSCTFLRTCNDGNPCDYDNVQYSQKTSVGVGHSAQSSLGVICTLKMHRNFRSAEK